MSFAVGPGVLQAMSDHGDEPRSDEMYVVLEEGKKVSETFGRDAEYVWMEVDNAVRRVPFR
jgi:hypothetical protein